MWMLEAVAAVLLTLASALVILAVVAADGWDEPERADEARPEGTRWRDAA